MYLVFTSDHLFVLWHHYQVGYEEFHTRYQSNHAVSHENKIMDIKLIEKAITFKLQGIFTILTYPIWKFLVLTTLFLIQG